MRKLLSVIGVTVVLFTCSPSPAQTGPALLLKPLMHEGEIWESHGYAAVSNNGTAEGGGDFDLSLFEYFGRFREQRERLIPRIGWEATHYSLDSDIPILDQSLTDASVAVGLELGKFSDWRAGLSAGFGYAGNSPFGESDAWYGKATLLVGRKFGPQSDLAFVLDYDGNRASSHEIVIPGIAYRRQHNSVLEYTLGFPFSSITWTPDKAIYVEINWTYIDQFDARLEYRLSPEWKIVGAVEHRLDAFSIDGIDDDDRLLFQQRRVEAGLRWQPWEHTSFMAAIGYSFTGEFSVGYDQDDSVEIADISDEPYVRIGFERLF